MTIGQIIAELRRWPTASEVLEIGVENRDGRDVLKLMLISLDDGQEPTRDDP